MTKNASIQAVLRAHGQDFHPVVPFDPVNDRLYPLDFTAGNKTLTPEQVADTESFAVWIKETLREHGARYGIGGYGEHRTLYARSKHFDTEEEPRRLHLGIDIWAPAGTKVMAPLDGIVHSFAFNNNDSDYGATLILTHHLEDIGFHILYGHLSLNSLKNRYEGQHISKGEVIGEFGMRFENGNWPPHLHIQVILDMEERKGDYPGVCKFSEKERWLEGCPDPDMILQMMQYAR
ncbi:MAG TPA: peptidoglycan DD-metalloendopeptidase family protein [Puia sp.]|nr:peptidoglycan DD-metalloendopeptidase family protein [Puia sp.]